MLRFRDWPKFKMTGRKPYNLPPGKAVLHMVRSPGLAPDLRFPAVTWGSTWPLCALSAHLRKGRIDMSYPYHKAAVRNVIVKLHRTVLAHNVLLLASVFTDRRAGILFPMLSLSLSSSLQLQREEGFFSSAPLRTSSGTAVPSRGRTFYARVPRKHDPT